MAQHRSTFELAGRSISAGSRKLVEIELAQLFTSTRMTLPVQVVHGRHEGPVMFVSAAVHGDELNGVEIIRRLLRSRLMRQIRGTLLAVPMVNMYGVLERSRYLPDRRDLNRSFPGSERGTMAARLAHTFMSEIVSRCTYGIDLHTAAIGRDNLPQIRANLDDESTEKLARAFGVPVLINSSLRDGSLRESALESGVTMLLYEAGGALRLDEMSIRAGLAGIVHVMRSVDMLPASRSRKIASEPFIARSSVWVRASNSGLFINQVSLGTRVEKEQTIGVIADPVTGEEFSILAAATGVIIGKSNQPLVHEGEALFHIGRFEASKRVAAEIETFQTEHQLGDGEAFEPPTIS
jgi:predicted deacylase